jgi:hypothetical protein
MNGDGNGDGKPPVPKYKAPDFMRKEMNLWLRGRYESALMRRYGDDDAPIRAISPIQAIRPTRPAGRIDRTTF